MPTFFLRYAGRDDERHAVECETLDDARNAAVRHLGQYLANHPGFASTGHWRVNVEDDSGAVRLHVIVATVEARTRGGARDTAVPGGGELKVGSGGGT